MTNDDMTTHLCCCPNCGSNEHLEHFYFPGCSYDYFSFYCVNDDCVNFIYDNYPESIKSNDYENGKKLAEEQWNKWASNFQKVIL